MPTDVLQDPREIVTKKLNSHRRLQTTVRLSQHLHQFQEGHRFPILATFGKPAVWGEKDAHALALGMMLVKPFVVFAELALAFPGIDLGLDGKDPTNVRTLMHPAPFGEYVKSAI